jgi:hypothetical protein
MAIEAAQTAGTLAFSASATATAGSSALTVRATGQGIRDVSAPLALVVQAAPAGFTLAVSSPTVTVQQGAQSSVNITVQRTGGFTGAVALAATGLPSGVSASFNPASVTGATSTLTLTAAATATAGTANVTVTGSGAGVPGRTASIALTVQSSGGSNSVSVTFCPATGIPIWVAFQDGPAGSWIRATAANGVYTGTIGSGRGTLAYVTTDAAGAFTTTVRYGTTAELRDFTAVFCFGATGTGKSVNVSIIGGGGEHVLMGLGTSPSVAPTGTPVAAFQNVPDGTVDLIAARSSVVGSARVINRVFAQRGLSPAAGSGVTVNFNGPTASDPVTAPLTITNLNFDQASVSSIYRTANQTLVLYGFDAPSTSASRTIAGFPEFAGSFHLMQVSAAPNLSSYDRLRTAGVVFAAVAPRSIALGPEMGSVAVSTLASGPTLRLQAVVPTSSPYHHSWSFTTTQGSGAQARSAIVQMTSGWLGSVLGSVTIDVPDLSTAGYQLDWGLRSNVSTNWSAIGQSTTGFGLQGQYAEGAVMLLGGRFGTRAP